MAIDLTHDPTQPNSANLFPTVTVAVLDVSQRLVDERAEY